MEERFSWIPFYKQAQKGQEPLRPRGSIHSAWKLQRSRAGFAAPIMSSEEHPSYYSPFFIYIKRGMYRGDSSSFRQIGAPPRSVSSSPVEGRKGSLPIAPIRPVSVNYCQFFHRIAK